MLAPGTIIGGRLRIDQILGAGGMGIVVAATHLELGNRVAVKVLRDELAQNPTIVERFIREARAVVNLRTDHVCRVFDVGRLDNGAPFIVMELLAGTDLAHAIAQRPLPVSIAADYIIQACSALSEAHALGIVHRDLKPANLFVTRRPDGGPLVKVLDFGIAKAIDNTSPALTHTSSVMGSPGFMSPEQLQSPRDVDLRTDIWALGVTLYQLVSGQMPFSAATLPEIAIRVATDVPTRIDVDPALGAVIDRCLRKLPAERYPNAAALAADLARFATVAPRMPPPAARPTFLPVSSDAPTVASLLTSPVAPRRAPRSKVPLVVAALVIVGGGIAAAVALSSKTEPAPSTPPVAPVVIATEPSTLVDPWAPKPGDDAGLAEGAENGTFDEDAAVDDPDMPDIDDIDDIEALAMMGSDYQAVVRAQCADAIKENPPAGSPGIAWFGQTVCYCMLKDRPNAEKAIAHVVDPAEHKMAVQACAPYGLRLK